MQYPFAKRTETNGGGLKDFVQKGILDKANPFQDSDIASLSTNELMKRFVFESSLTTKAPLQTIAFLRSVILNEGRGAFLLSFESLQKLKEGRPTNVNVDSLIRRPWDCAGLTFFSLRRLVGYFNGSLTAQQQTLLQTYNVEETCVILTEVFTETGRAIRPDIKKRSELDDFGRAAAMRKYFYRCRGCNAERGLRLCQKCKGYFECSIHAGNHICVPDGLSLRIDVFQHNHCDDTLLAAKFDELHPFFQADEPAFEIEFPDGENEPSAGFERKIKTMERQKKDAEEQLNALHSELGYAKNKKGKQLINRNKSVISSLGGDVMQKQQKKQKKV